MVKKSMTNDEATFVRLTCEKFMTVNEMKKAGAHFDCSSVFLFLSKLELKGFLLYEEQVRPNSKVCRYGLMGVREGSYAEQWCKENNIKFKHNKVCVDSMIDFKSEYYQVCPKE